MKNRNSLGGNIFLQIISSACLIVGLLILVNTETHFISNKTLLVLDGTIPEESIGIGIIIVGIIILLITQRNK